MGLPVVEADRDRVPVLCRLRRVLASLEASEDQDTEGQCGERHDCCVAQCDASAFLHSVQGYSTLRTLSTELLEKVGATLSSRPDPSVIPTEDDCYRPEQDTC